MDVREGASGASADSPERRSWTTASLILNWQLTKNNDLEKLREREENWREKEGKCAKSYPCD